MPMRKRAHQTNVVVYVCGTASRARLHAPAELDVDVLAEAIRQLLTSNNAPSDAHLLSPRRGVTHVVEANEALLRNR